MLSGVILGEGVIREAGVIIKENIILPALENTLQIEDDGNTRNTNSLFYGGISVNGKPYVHKTTQQLAESVVIRGRILVDPEHIGKKAEIFIYSPYWNITRDTLPVGYYMADTQAQILSWDEQLASLQACQQVTNLSAVHEIEMFAGHFIATGCLNIVFGYRLEDGTVVMHTLPSTIDVSIQ